MESAEAATAAGLTPPLLSERFTRFDDLTYFDGYDAIRLYRFFERVGTVYGNSLAEGLLDADYVHVVTVYKVSDKPEDMTHGQIMPVRIFGAVSYNSDNEPHVSSRFPQPRSIVGFNFGGHEMRGMLNVKGHIIGLGGIPYKETVSGRLIPGGFINMQNISMQPNGT